MVDSKPPPEVEAVLRQAYAAFNARDVEAALALMHPDVDWPNAWEGGRIQGREAVRSYWIRQFAVIDVRVDPVSFALAPDGRVVVDVHQVVRDQDAAVVADRRVQHIYLLRDGLIQHMEVRET